MRRIENTYVYTKALHRAFFLPVYYNKALKKLNSYGTASYSRKKYLHIEVEE